MPRSVVLLPQEGLYYFSKLVEFAEISEYWWHVLILQLPDDSAVSLTTIIRHHEIEYLNSLQVSTFSFPLSTNLLHVLKFFLIESDFIDRCPIHICQTPLSRYRRLCLVGVGLLLTLIKVVWWLTVYNQFFYHVCVHASQFSKLSCSFWWFKPSVCSPTIFISLCIC